MPESHLFQNWTAEVLLAGNRGRTSSVGRALECIKGGCGFDHRGRARGFKTSLQPPEFRRLLDCTPATLVITINSWQTTSISTAAYFSTVGHLIQNILKPLGRTNTQDLNPLAPKRDQHQFSPNNIGRWTRVKVMRITKLITKGWTLWSWTKFSQLFLKRICMWIMGLKGLKELCHEIYQIQTVGTSSKLSEI